MARMVGAKGYALTFIEELVQQNLNNEPVPFALVAHHDGTFLGTASVIASDLDVRPLYTPWVAAVWVEPAYRASGVGAALVQAAAEAAQGLGFDCTYLCALPPNHGFYKRIGWEMLEANVTETGLAVFRSP